MSEAVSDWIDNAKQPFTHASAKKIEVRFHTGDVGVIGCPACHKPSVSLVKDWRPTELPVTDHVQMDAMRHRARQAQGVGTSNLLEAKNAEIQRLIEGTHRLCDEIRKLKAQLNEIEVIGNIYWKDFRKDWAAIKKQRDAMPMPAEPPGSIVYSMLGVLCLTTLDLSASCEFKDRVMELRMEQGESVEILCDNEEGPNAVACSSEFTGWEEKRFEGKDVLECLQNACKARREWWFHELCKIAREKGLRGIISNGFEEHLTGYIEGNTPRQEFEEQLDASR